MTPDRSVRRVLVTGVAGFVGSHLARALLERDLEVVGLDDLSTGRRERVPRGVHFVEADVCHVSIVERILDQTPCEAVVHLAAQVSVAAGESDPAFDRRVNLDATADLVRLAARRGVKTFVFASSAAVYGDPQQLPLTESAPIRPLSAYGLHKWLAERYIEQVARHSGIRHVNLRYANVYGPGQRAAAEGGVVAVFMDRLHRGEPLLIHGDGRQTRDFIHVDDVVAATVAAVQGTAEGTYNISSATQTPLLELVAALAAASGRTPELRFGDPRPGDIRHSVLDNAAARRALGWSPTTGLEEGLRRTWSALCHLAPGAPAG